MGPSACSPKETLSSVWPYYRAVTPPHLLGSEQAARTCLTGTAGPGPVLDSVPLQDTYVVMPVLVHTIVDSITTGQAYTENKLCSFLSSSVQAGTRLDILLAAQKVFTSPFQLLEAAAAQMHLGVESSVPS